MRAIGKPKNISPFFLTNLFGLYRVRAMERGIQAALSRAAGITEGGMSNMLHGRCRPSWGLAKKLAALTGTEPSLWMDSPPEVLREAASKFKALSPAPAGK